MTPENIETNHKRKALWMRRAADGLSLARAIAGPLLGYHIAQNPGYKKTSTVLALAAISATDYLDGKLAKKAHKLDESQRKPYGAWLDQMADKALVHSLLAGMAVRSGRERSLGLTAFFALNGAIQLGRDTIVTNIRKQAAEHNINTSARNLGRAKTAVTLTALTVSVLPEANSPVADIQKTSSLSGIAAGTVLSIVSGATLAHELNAAINKSDQTAAFMPTADGPRIALRDTNPAP